MKRVALLTLYVGLVTVALLVTLTMLGPPRTLAQILGSTPVPTTVVSPQVYVAGGQGDFQLATADIARVWSRTDKPVAEDRVGRTWFWGPGPNTSGLYEQYKDDPLGKGLRLVQYFDKSRMEVDNPNANPNQPFFVTNGLLTVELVSGQIQVGNSQFVPLRPACIPVTGDPGDTQSPTYYVLQQVANSLLGNHYAPDRTGQTAIDTIDQGGKVGSDATRSSASGVKFVYFEPATRHNIPQVFWDFLNSSGPIYDNSGRLVTGRLSNPWFFASGLPLSEPYWTKATIKGASSDVLIQAYERVVLTYVPGNPTGWKVEIANIGQHYFDWRYRNAGVCPGTAPGPQATPIIAPTSTHTGTPTRTSTPSATPTRLIPTSTPTVRGIPSKTPTFTHTPIPNTSTPPPTFTRTPIPNTSTPPPTFTHTATATHTSVPTSTHTSTPTGTATDTHTPTPGVPPTETPVSTATSTPTDTVTPTPGEPPTETPVSTATITPTGTATSGPTDTVTPTPGEPPTETPVSTATITPTGIPTSTLTTTPATALTSAATVTPTTLPVRRP